MKLLQEERAFTLVEVLLSSILLVLVLATAFQGLKLVNDYYAGAEARLDRQQNVRLALDRLSSEAREASRVTKPDYLAGETTSELWLFYAAGRTTSDGDPYNQVRYYLSGGQLLRGLRQAADPLSEAVSWQGNNVVAYGIDRLEFTAPEADLLTIKVGSGAYQARTTVYLRVGADY